MDRGWRPPRYNTPALTSIRATATMKVMGGEIPIQLGRFLVIAGVCLVIFGLIVMAGSKFSFFGLGRLPGDIAVKGKNFQFYFPVATCVILSVVATLALWLISFLTRR